MKEYKKWIAVSVSIILCICASFTWHFYQRHSGNRTWSIIYIPKAADGTNDFWTSLISGTRMAAREYGVEFSVHAPAAEQNLEEQLEILREAIKEKPDAILFTPSSFTEATELVREAREKGIFVGYIDSYTEEELQQLTVATDNLEVGRILGQYVSGIVSDDSKIAMVSHMKGVSTAVEREQGFREGLGDLEDNIVEVVYSDSLFEKAYELTKELMEKYPDLEMIAGTNEDSTVGAARAISEAHAQDRIKVVGVDSSIEAVGFMEMGVIKALVVQKAFRMGYMGVEQTVHMLNGEKVDPHQNSGCELVTLDNMYDAEIEKLLYPFNRIK